MKKYIIPVVIGLLALGITAGCKKKTDTLATDQVAEYMPLQVGKYILYRLDSTNYVAHGQKDTVISYQAKDVVESAITDNLGRAGWRIVRYLRDTASTDDADWKPTLTYQVTPTRNFMEVYEPNFRYLKLALPIQEAYSWKGNNYLPSDPYGDLYEFSNDEDIQTWDYTYQDIGATLNLNSHDYDSTITILQMADSANVPITPGVPAYTTYWIEKYAKHIGLVYKEVVMWEYQPPSNSNSGYRHGFGIKMTILDHN